MKESVETLQRTLANRKERLAKAVTTEGKAKLANEVP